MFCRAQFTAKVDNVQWRNKVAVGPRESIPKEPPLPPKKLKKTASGKFWAPTTLGPRALHALHPIVTSLIMSVRFVHLHRKIPKNSRFSKMTIVLVSR